MTVASTGESTREAEKTRETKVPAVTSLRLWGGQEDKVEIEEC